MFFSHIVECVILLQLLQSNDVLTVTVCFFKVIFVFRALFFTSLDLVYPGITINSLIRPVISESLFYGGVACSSRYSCQLQHSSESKGVMYPVAEFEVKHFAYLVT